MKKLILLIAVTATIVMFLIGCNSGKRIVSNDKNATMLRNNCIILSIKDNAPDDQLRANLEELLATRAAKMDSSDTYGDGHHKGVE